MNSANWTFVGNGSTASVILKHGVESGNLIIFCNMKIMLIDFGVFEKKDYTFFIEEECCQIKVWKRKGKFNYQFDVLDDVDTPLNNKRRERRDKLYDNTVWKALAALGIVGFILLLGYATNYYKIQQIKRVTVGTLVLQDHLFNGVTYNAAYSFKSHKKTMMRHLQLNELSDGTLVLDNGLPALTGDEYPVSYFQVDPKKNDMVYDKILEDQNELLVGRVINKMLYLNPSLTPEYCVCIIENSVLSSPVPLYANLYFQNSSPADNPNHNSETYNALMQHPDMIERKKSCYYSYVEQCDD